MEEGKKEGKKEGKRIFFCVPIVVCIFLIVGLDIFAGFVGLEAEAEAEAAQQNVEPKSVWLVECKAPSQTAFKLGIIALGCLVAAHIISMMIGCSISNIVKVSAAPNISGYLNMTCLCLFWIVGIVGAGLLGMGIWTNRESRSKCGFTNKHVFYLGGKVCFLHAIVSVVLYVSTMVAKISYRLEEVDSQTSESKPALSTAGQNIGLGPQFDSQTSQSRPALSTAGQNIGLGPQFSGANIQRT